MRCAILILAFCLCAFPAWSQQSQDLDALTRAEAEARQTEQRLKAEREIITQEIARLKSELTDATEQTRAFEQERLRLANRVSELNTKINGLKADLDANRAKTQALLASLQRLQMAPNLSTYADPDDAVRTAQAATMIDLLSGLLQDRAQTVLQLTRDLEQARQVAAERQTELDATASELDRRRATTQTLVAEKERLRQSIQTDEDKAREDVARLAQESATLRELLERVSAAAKDVTPRLKPGQRPGSGPVTLPPGTLRFAEAKGALIQPVSGRLISAFGRGERGQTYATVQGGDVLAPYAGRVEFAGAFKTYDQVVILNMDDGYFLLLTGLGETFVDAGETVSRGEPVGRMPDRGETVPLYLELRRDGRTIDPAPWMS